MQNSGMLLLGKFLNTKRHIEQATTLTNLTQGEFLVLRRIKLERDENESKNIAMFKAVKISEYLKLPAPAVSRILNSLETRGLITRNINKKNRRSIIISLTDNGKNLLEEAEEIISLFAKELIDELGEKNSEIFMEVLDKITEFCEKKK